MDASGPNHERESQTAPFYSTTTSRLYIEGARVDEWSSLGKGRHRREARRVSERARANQIVASYTWGEPSYHHYDANGNCMTVTNAAGNITEQYYYDAFGKPYMFDAMGNWLSASPSGNRFLFTGREYISELKLYDFRNRLYNPQMGRFLQPDPKEFAAGDYNLYRYCHNDPVNKSDPTGLEVSADEETTKMMDDARNLNDSARSAIDQLRSSKKVHVFKNAEDKDNVRPRGPNGLKGNGAEANRTFGDWLKHLFGPYDKSGSTIYFNPRNNQDVKGVFRSALSQLLHEIGHALDYDNGTTNDNLIGKPPIPVSEARAIWWENEANKSLGLDLREWNDYGRVDR
jgi:RHS repeat-associated protein